MPHSRPCSPTTAGILKNDTANDEQACTSQPSATQTGGARSSTPKCVSIGHVSEMISPLMLGKQKSVEDFALEPGRRHRRPSIKSANAMRMTGKAPSASSPRMKPVHTSSASLLELRENTAAEDAFQQIDSLIEQITQWMNQEKLKRAGSTSPWKHADARTTSQDSTEFETLKAKDAQLTQAQKHDPDFDQLAQILKHGRSFLRTHGRKCSVASIRRKLSLKNLQRKASSSDTEHVDHDALVPSSDVVLDNSKTLNYTGGASSESEASDDETDREVCFRDLDAWAKFKFEILRLVHTLRLKGWRKVPLESSARISVQRLSGALTNAVYVVAPPKDWSSKTVATASSEVGTSSNASRNPPPKLLLRIYGPQVEHLIDRESELAILRRLARKRIGPRLLGTFANGRFEEFFHAQTLTPPDLRNPDTSRQIAKRMRELHDGIDLLEQERDDGPFIWRNWDKWVQRVEQVVSWLDAQIVDLPEGAKPSGDEAWKRRGFICGVSWKYFREMVEKYRAWLETQYGGLEKLKSQLVFAHNDTQYGNILRLIPTGESPLLLPANTHKQLIVIDFEYSNANLPGLEFANHFTEWCYNYHDERKPYACNTSRYPTPEEQERFIRAYVRHRPQFNVSSPKMTPQASPRSSSSSTPTLNKLARRPTSSITDFMLDARTPSGTNTQQTCDEEVAKASEDAEVERLTQETRLWRLANSAQWVAWGIVQAKVPGMPDFDRETCSACNNPDEECEKEHADERTDLYRELASNEPIDEKESREVAEEEEFDYLGYAQHRAMFFWGDIVQLGFLKREDLPAEVQEKLKIVPY